MKDLDINQLPSGAEEEWITAGMDDEEESTNGAPPRKKLRLSKEQSRLLEESFRQRHTLNPVNSPSSLLSIHIYLKVMYLYDYLCFSAKGWLLVVHVFKFDTDVFGVFGYAETERGISFAVEAEAKTSWGVVSKP